MKRWMTYLLAMAGVLIVLIVLNVGFIFAVAINTDNNKYLEGADAYSSGIAKSNDSYHADDRVLKKLDEMNAFAFIIGDDGKVAWSYNKPTDIPDEYSITDVAAFSKWYLEGYPVHCRIRENELLIIGYEKDSVWKYNFELGLNTMKSLLRFFPYLIILNVLILFLLPAWITKRWAKEKEESRSKWIAGVSHDIRTPLSIVLGNAPQGSVTESQCLRIKELVNNLNTENKLEAGTGSWNKEQVKLVPIIRDVVVNYINANDAKYNFEMDIDASIENCMICADQSLFRRMLENIISNSIRHNEEGCVITISLKSLNRNKIQMTVSDNGHGTDQATVVKLNKKPTNGYLPEHGLGLRVVNQICKKYKYKIRYSSELGEYFSTDISLPIIY